MNNKANYSHLKELDKNELIAIIKDCDAQINYLNEQLKGKA